MLVHSVNFYITYFIATNEIQIKCDYFYVYFVLVLYIHVLFRFICAIAQPRRSEF